MAITETAKAYQRGYNAGRKRTEDETKSAIDAANRNWEVLKDKRLEIATVIMGHLVTTTLWKIGQKQINDMAGNANLAKIGADALLKEFGQ